MTIIDDRTVHLSLALPNAGNVLLDDVARLRSALTDVDTAVNGKQASLGFTAENAANKNAVNGYAGLDSGGKVAAAQLPSYVDDVLEFANLAGFPVTGETGKIYTAIDTGKIFRWSGTVYIEISASPGSTDVVPEGTTNLYFTPGRALAAVPIATAIALGLVKIGSGLSIDGAGVVSLSGSSLAFTELSITPTSNGQTVFTISGGYTAGAIELYLNGVLLYGSGDDYTASNGTSITLVVGANTVDTLLLRKWSSFSVANAVLKSGDTMTGGLSVPSINSGYLYGNRVINGAQEIDQTNNGASVTTVVGNVHLTDMFGVYATQGSKLTGQQVLDAPPGLKNSLKITVASQYSPIAGDVFNLVSMIEGKDVIDFQFGTSGAQTITLNKWIKGSVPGTYAVAIRNQAYNRSYVGTFSVTTAWEQVKITLQCDTTGVWATDSTAGLIFNWDLGSGSNANTTAIGSWQAGDALRTSCCVTFVYQAFGSPINITGVDCRLGSVAPTVFEHRMNELQLCKRMTPAWYAETALTDDWFANGWAVSTTQALITFPFDVEARTAPTGIVMSSGGNWNIVNSSGSPIACSTTPTFYRATKRSITILCTVASGLTQGLGTAFSAGAAGSIFYATGARLF